MEPREGSEEDDADDAPKDIDAVGPYSLWVPVESSSKLLAGTDEDERDQQEEETGEELDGNENLRNISGQAFAAKVDHLWRRLVADVHHGGKLVGEQLSHEGSQNCHREESGRPSKVLAWGSSGQAANRHAEERSEQNDIREEGQVEDVGREPADASELEKEDQQADQEQVDARAVCGEEADAGVGDGLLRYSVLQGGGGSRNDIVVCVGPPMRF